jgi:tyrosyl-tRNA synthetase
MYGKLMSISDELMWKYFLFLTDLRGSEVELLKAEVAAGKLHPMEAKKRLARTIISGFHGEEAAQSADENWAKMFQQKEVSEDLEEVAVAFADVAGPAGAQQIRLPKLLVHLGLAASNAEANRKIAEKAVKLDGEAAEGALIPVALPARIVVRLGKRAKVAVIT